MNHKILVVDDINENQELLLKLLDSSKNGYTYKVAGNGKEAIELARKENPGLILMDWKMPVMDGIEATRILKEDPATKNIPILLITAYASDQNLEEAFQAGANDYIKKPIKGRELISRVNSFLSLNSALNTINEQKGQLEKQNLELSQLHSIISRSDNSIFVTGADLSIIWGNEGFEKVHGMTIEQFKQKNGSKINSRNYHPEIEEQAANALKSMESFSLTHEIKSEPGEKWIQVSVTPTNDMKNETRFVFIETDITRQKEIENELNLKNEHMLSLTEYLEETNKALETKTKEIEDKRTELENQKAQSENLLNSLFPKEVAWQLKSKGKAKPRHYKQVSVLFADFKSFSKICQDLEPQEIINILDSYFKKFDDVIESHYIEKIKTIGDAYMCVGGLPLRNKSHPFDVVLAALEIQHYMNKLNDQKVLENLPVWELRIGVHTGDVVAGVVGKQKFAYDIWGKNVNIACRMEQHGAVGMVNISGSTYDLIKDHFNCVNRGEITIKHGEKINMFFVEGLKEQYASKNSRFLPNDNFKEFLRQI